MSPDSATPDRLIPLTLSLTESEDNEGLGEAIVALLARRGPTEEEAIECWIRERHRLNVLRETLAMFESGAIDFFRVGARGEVFVALVEREATP